MKLLENRLSAKVPRMAMMMYQNNRTVILQERIISKEVMKLMIFNRTMLTMRIAIPLHILVIKGDLNQEDHSRRTLSIMMVLQEKMFHIFLQKILILIGRSVSRERRGTLIFYYQFRFVFDLCHGSCICRPDIELV